MVALATCLRSQSDDPISKLQAKGRLTREQAGAARLLREALRGGSPGRRGSERRSSPDPDLVCWVREIHLRIGLEAPPADRGLAWSILQAVVVEGRHIRPVADALEIGPPRAERLLTLALDVIASDPPPS